MKKENKVAGIYFTAATKKISKGNCKGDFVAQVILNTCYADRLPNGRFIEAKVWWDSTEKNTPKGGTYSTRSRAKTAADKVRHWYFINRDPLAHRVSA